MSTKAIVIATVAIAVVGAAAYKVNKFRNNLIQAFKDFDAEVEKQTEKVVEEAATETTTA